MIPQNDLHLLIGVETFKNKSNRSVQRKIDKLQAYFDVHDIKDVVVGVSGGVDSALVLALLSRVQGIRIHAVMITFAQYQKVFDPEYFYTLKRSFDGWDNIEWYDLDLTESFCEFQRELGIHLRPAQRANSNYAMRYLAFFTIAQSVGGVTIGTTNRDEMGYAGWFGKNSDMMVDIQPIADLHKFEVIWMADELGIPKTICERVPTGDLIDGTSDEENFGCSYDELSWFTDFMLSGGEPNEFLSKKFAGVIDLHTKNAHKYQGQTFNPIFL